MRIEVGACLLGLGLKLTSQATDETRREDECREHADAEERKLGESLFAEANTSRRQAAEDLLWALLNTPEFFFKD